MNYKKGFTLIELLVVIAIIGILSSVVLASLNTARDKGADAKIKGEVGSIRAAAEMYYDTKGQYDSATIPASVTCATGMFSDASVIRSLNSATSTSGGATTSNRLCTSSTTAYAVSVKLKSGSWYCVDSSGNATTTTNATVISTTDASCN